ncbi:hypothetical protein ONZ45_g1446 [Pleurotus djamor]|nr:hypothetical protein ONZ45_g1446 [Pleurotus djamor]
MQTADANGHLTNLNDAQRKGKDFLLPILSNPHIGPISAVHHPPHIPLQILAGPGSGKTRVLTSRIAHLILHHAIPSASICAVTFTNKAANEMKERLTKLLGAEQTRTLKLGTFHALCASFLRKYASLVGLSNNFSVCDADESKKIISRLLKPYKTFLDAKDITLKEGTVLSMISKHKYKGFTATEVLSELRTPPSVVSEKENITAQSKSKARSTEIDHVVAEVYREYEKALRKSNSLDFDDLLLFGLELFKHHEKSLIWCKHVLVDEFQDTNSIQYELMKTIANSASECLTVVGDPDQSIYGWRSADVTNLAKMRKDFAQTESVLLEENYRSTASILKASLAIVAQDKARLPKSLHTSHPPGNAPSLMSFASDRDEAAFIASEIKRLTAQMGGVLTWKDFAILLRFNALSRAIESALQRVGIPCRILGGHRFFERAEVGRVFVWVIQPFNLLAFQIKDLLAYLQLVDNPHFSPAFIRAINVPARGIGEKTLEELSIRAEKTQKQPMDVVELIHAGKQPDIKPPIKRKIASFVDTIQSLRTLALNDASPMDIIRRLIELIGYEQHLKQAHPDWESRWENVQELITFASEVINEPAFPLDEPASEDEKHTPLRTFLQASVLSSEGDQSNAENNNDAVFSDRTPDFLPADRAVVSRVLGRSEPNQAEVTRRIADFNRTTRHPQSVECPEAPTYNWHASLMKPSGTSAEIMPSSRALLSNMPIKQAVHQPMPMAQHMKSKAGTRMIPTRILQPQRPIVKFDHPPLAEPVAPTPTPAPIAETSSASTVLSTATTVASVGVKRRLGVGRSYVGYSNKKFKPPT